MFFHQQDLGARGLIALNISVRQAIRGDSEPSEERREFPGRAGERGVEKHGQVAGCIL